MGLLSNTFASFGLSSTKSLGEDYIRIKDHLIKRINETEAGFDPFGHVWIDNLFPKDYYDRLFAHMNAQKTEDKMQPRAQDNPEFTNRRFNLVKNNDLEVRIFRGLWNDPDVRFAAYNKFYTPEAAKKLTRRTRIHEEFEYVFCEPGRFQNIHVDIPPKMLSFVFYLPDDKVSDEDEQKNATVLYDKNLEPRYGARFRENSVCIFAQHFYSYHGFSTTRTRDVMVMFMIEPSELKRWRKLSKHEEAPFEGILEAIDQKLQRYELREYGSDAEKRQRERELCRINAPMGRALFH